MKDHENMSEALKNREQYHRRMRERGNVNVHPQTVRFSLKDLEKDFAKTEDDIKAVQSVGQIIGEVMKQLDDERCTH